MAKSYFDILYFELIFSRFFMFFSIILSFFMTKTFFNNAPFKNTDLA